MYRKQGLRNVVIAWVISFLTGMKMILSFCILLLLTPVLFSVKTCQKDDGEAPGNDSLLQELAAAIHGDDGRRNYNPDSCIVFSLEDFGQVDAYQVNGGKICTFSPDGHLTRLYRLGGKDGLLMHTTYYDFDLHARVIHPSFSDLQAITIAYYAWQHGYVYEYDHRRRLHLLHLRWY